jgi:hypothetical protein
LPSLQKSLVELDPQRYERMEPKRMDPKAPIERHIPFPFLPMPAPEPPIGIRRSALMISSLPVISTNVDGVLRQFYGAGNFPSRRLVSP